MPDDALLLTDAALQPLADSAGTIDAAMDAVEQVTLALYRDEARQQTFLGHPQSEGRVSARLNLATAAKIGTGVRVFGIPAPDYLGLARAVNTRFYVLLDAETGQLLALLGYGRLNPLRVGAVGGVAARHLAPTGARTLALLGSGQQARTQLQAVSRAVPGLQRVLVYSPTPAHREAFAVEVSSWLGVHVEAVDSVEAATRDADIVDLANSSRVPVIERSQVKPGALVITVTEGRITPEFVDTTRAVFITQDALAHNLIMREPYASRIQAGTFMMEDLAAELPAVVAGQVDPRRTPDDVVVFELTAANIHDLAIARWAYTWARANGVGTPFVLSNE
jgi:alanine dehydrogenase